MKNPTLFAMIGALVALSAAADEAPFPHITVYGTATTEVVPDQMVWSLRVENKGPVLKTVAGEHAKTVQEVLAFLKQSKVESKELQTSRMQFSENWEYRSSSRVREGYTASTAISFKTTDLDLYASLWQGLADMKVVSVQGVTYDHTRRIEIQNETRDKAIRAAKDKARASAGTLGVAIGAPLLLEEDLSASEGWEVNMGAAMLSNARVSVSGEGQGPMAAIAPGTIPIRIRVKAAFQLLPLK
jgi:uncharacterized protein YggE